MSSAEFLRKWDASEFRDPDSAPGVMEVVMLQPHRLPRPFGKP